MKGWCLRKCMKEDNMRNRMSNEIIFTNINKFIEHLKYEVNLDIKLSNKKLIILMDVNDYNEKYIKEIKKNEFIYYDENVDYACWIEVHDIIN